MVKIAFDVNGNDNGVRAGVESALKFVQDNLDFLVILVGDQAEIKKYIKENERIIIKHSENTISTSEGLSSIRHSKNSMMDAVELVKNGEADVILSSGDSAAYLSLTTLHLGRLPGIKRPAFMPIMPTIIGKKFLLLDVGANIESTSEMLVQWAKLATVFSKSVLSIEKPSVSLLNIGVEEYKGKQFHKEANEIMKSDKEINYIGFSEPRKMMEFSSDIVVTDGYAGNIALKSIEGSVLALLKLLKKNIKAKVRFKIASLFMRKAFKNTKKVLDYRNVGAAWIIGLNKLAIKTHGSSDSKAYEGAFNQIAIAVEKDAMKKLKEAIENNDK